jgi:alginate O-acetyltransferase complex protein AlgJ
MTAKQTVTRPVVRDVIFVALFLAIITCPAWGSLLGLPDMPSAENRAVATLPTLTDWQEVPVFQRGVEQYLSDRFFERIRIVHLVTTVKVDVFGETTEPVPNVILGSHGWLYYVQGNQNIEEGHYSEADLAEMQANVDHIRALLQARGILLVVVIAPEKQSIYPEYLPADIRLQGSETGLDQIATYFHEHGRTPFVDLRPALWAAKTQGQVYLRTDTHWTSFGAYVGWRQIHAWLSTQWPGLGPAAELSTFTPVPAQLSGDLARMLTMGGIWSEDTVIWRPPTTGDSPAKPDKPRLLVFGDSFAQAILPYLLLDSSTMRAVASTPNCVDFKPIEEEKPAVVIWLTVERFQSVLWCSPLNVPTP